MFKFHTVIEESCNYLVFLSSDVNFLTSIVIPGMDQENIDIFCLIVQQII